MKKRSIRLSVYVVISLVSVGLYLLFFQNSVLHSTTNALSETVLSNDTSLASTATPAHEKLINSVVQSASVYTESRQPIFIDYPPDSAIFPPEMIAPMFSWHDPSENADTWVIDFMPENTSAHIYVVTTGIPLPEKNIDPDCISTTNELPVSSEYELSAVNWLPDDDVWETIKSISMETITKIAIYGLNRSSPDNVLSAGTMHMTTSSDSIGACLFYRDVPLMPSSGEGEKIQPLGNDKLKLIKWHLRDLSQPDSRVVLTDVPTCANCHSFSNNGTTLGMDIDGPQSDKGSYTIKAIEKHMVIDHDDIISWNHLYRNNATAEKSIGFLSQVSPDGQYAVTTLKEDLFVENYLDYRFLQVFFPTRGILGYWSQKSGEVQSLPGADNPAFVHCDPAWSPDGSYLVFARATAKDPYTPGQELAPYTNSPLETFIQYDLYRISFNNGSGGVPKLIAGASNNGMSNCFPKITPDGKFIIFVKCQNGQLMRPDSKLWIVPVEGGEAREMNCNMDVMNSWHTISPNSRWMVFSSKSRSPYTQLFITHLNEDGSDSPALLIPNSTADNRAANIPEFVAINFDDLIEITIPGMEYQSILKTSITLSENGKYKDALAALDSLLVTSPDDPYIRAEILTSIGDVYFMNGYLDVAVSKFEEAVAIDPECASAYSLHGSLLETTGNTYEAVEMYRHALTINPNNVENLYALIKVLRSSYDGAIRNTAEAIELAERASKLTKYRDVGIIATLAESYAADGQFDKALETGTFLLKQCHDRGLHSFANDFEKRMALYRQGRYN